MVHRLQEGKESTESLLQRFSEGKPWCDITQRWLKQEGKNEDYDPWGTHQPFLIQALMFTKEDVLELGAGDNSTPVIGEFAGSFRYCLTMETDQEWWLKCNEKYEQPNVHNINLFTDYTKFKWNLSNLDDKWDLAFVDNAPGEARVNNILRLKHNANIILVHDWQEGGYQYHKVIEHFKYIKVFKDFSTTTAALSNVINLDALPWVSKPIFKWND